MTGQSDVYDITFIGGGPVGLYGAYYAGARGLKVKIIDSQPKLGGRLTALYPDKTIYDVAGHPSVVAKDYVRSLVEQARRYQPEIRHGERVTGLLADEEGYRLKTGKDEHRSRTVVIAAGAGAFVPEGLDLAGPSIPPETHIYYDIDDMERFRNKRVVVVGAGDNALEWALKLHLTAEEVTLVHRLNNLDPGAASFEDFSKTGVELKFPYFEIKAIHGDKKIEAVTFYNTQTGEEERRKVDALVLNVGFLANLSEFRDWGIELSGNAIRVNERMETNLPGVFAAGDIVTHPGKIKLISTGAGEAAIAVNSAAQYLERRRDEARRKAAGAERVLQTPERFYSGFEAAQLAIALIQEAVRFYSRAFFASASQDVKQLFARLQREGHDITAKLRGEVLAEVGGKGYAQEDLDDTAGAYLRGSLDPRRFGGFSLAHSFRGGVNSDLEAVYTAIRLHEDSIAFFKTVAVEKSLQAAKTAFDWIVKQEEEHLEALRGFQREMMERPLQVE
jgi:thioredoxin reductase/rubrerythrin